MKTKIWGCILGAVMFASALQSCQTQVEIPDGAVYPILFGSTESRAVAGLKDIKSGGFKVYAYFEGNKGSASFEKDVTYNHEQNVWGYEDLEYWIPNTNYWFKAVYPGNAAVVDNNNNDQTLTIADYDIQSQTDVMVATATASVAENATAPTSGSVVNLTFEHLLANVVIAIKSEISGVTINNITLSNIADHGKYDGEDWNSSNTGEVTITSGVDLVQNADHVDVTNGGIMVIPGNAGGHLTIEASNKTYKDIKIPSGTTWEKGNRYTYTAVIKHENIVFNEPTADKWDSESATGSVIIK